jgi:hypothetical protein
VRSRPELVACVAALLLAAPAIPAADPLSEAEITQAIEKVKADPALQTERTQRMLQWDEEPKKKNPKRNKWWDRIADLFGWIGDLFGWIAQVSQMLMWLVIAALVALLALVLAKLFVNSRPQPGTRNPLAPTHVRDLDIRPESLPADIGATARALWERGEHRAALALLYRGMLSRLAHSFAVPIRDSSTEGDCLALASRALDARQLDYVTRLVRAWQLAIYAGRRIDDAVVHELCDAFDAHLPPAQDPAAPGREAPARGAPA